MAADGDRDKSPAGPRGALQRPPRDVSTYERKAEMWPDNGREIYVERASSVQNFCVGTERRSGPRENKEKGT